MLYKTLILVLGDLETWYSELLSGQRWLAIGHGAPVGTSAFISNPDSDNDCSDVDEYGDYAAFTALAG